MKPPKYVQVQGRMLKLTHLDRVIYPETRFLKEDVIRYYQRIAPFILPHLKDRPLTLKRYPEGVNANYFFEKRCAFHRPRWITTTQFGDIQHCVINDLPTLLWVANLASLELHVTLATKKDLSCPTFMLFDLDPGEGADFKNCCELAILLRTRLERQGLQSLAKSSGQKGLHLYVPLNSQATYTQTSEFSRFTAKSLEKELPDQVISKMNKRLRAGKIFIDWSQNVDFKTTVAVYSLRATQVPNVSMPLSWREVSTAARKESKARELNSIGAAEALERVERVGDLFAPALRLVQTLPDPGSLLRAA